MPEVILQSMFSRILTFSGWPGWLNANGYKYAMLYLDANIKDACYSSKATLPLGNKKSILKKSAKWSLFLDPVTHGTNQYWFIINKKIPHILLGELARLVMEPFSS